MSGRAIAIIQARMTSTRLPGKVMLPLAGRPVLAHVVDRAKRIAGIDDVCVAIPAGAAQLPIVEFLAGQPDLTVISGPEDDVLARYVLAARETEADIVVRITADCPLLDPAIAATVLAACRESNGYARTAFDRGVPYGLDVEACPTTILNIADGEATDPYEREHVMPFMWRRPDRFPAVIIDRMPDRRAWRLTLDEEADFRLIRRIHELLGPDRPVFGLTDIEALFADHPALATANAAVVQTPIIGAPGRFAAPGGPPA